MCEEEEEKSLLWSDSKELEERRISFLFRNDNEWDRGGGVGGSLPSRSSEEEVEKSKQAAAEE